MIASLIEANTQTKLRMQLSSALADGSVLRMHLNEEEPVKRTRYEAMDALRDDISFVKVNLLESSDSGFTITFGSKGKAVVSASPFRVDVYVEDKLKIVANQRQLMRFEKSREKSEGEKSEEGEWEESFGSHSDSKPYGPMSVGMDISFVDFDHLYGLPEHADSFSLRNTKGATDPYRLYNLDVFEYEVNNPMALYGSVPMIVAHNTESTVGMIWLNPSETWVDVESTSTGITGMISNLMGQESKARSAHWISETGVIDIWFLTGPTVADVVKQNAMLSGTHPMPPYYSIGYHQCRWNYFTQEEVIEVDNGFDEHDIPLDAIWLDVEHTEGRSKKYFTWDPVAFSDPKTMISNLTSEGRRLIAVINPHIKRDTNYPVYNEGLEQNLFVKNKDGSVYDGKSLPGSSSWPDYLDPKVREWWSRKFDPEYFPGFKGGVVDIWNDMNEPSVSSGPEETAPKDLVHYQGLEHRDVHNIYGLLMTKSTFDGHMTYRPNLRSFILTRAFFLGSQRFCAAWTGDNMGKFEHLKMTVPMMLSLGITGIAFSGADVPGFFYNPEPELVVRWYQAGAFQPFFRAHAHIDTKRREPWHFDETTKNLIRAAIRTRYSYLPYMYTLFYENHADGLPIMRPLWFHYPQDINSYPADESYLLGDSLLVHPIVEKDVSTLDVYFPGSQKDQWLDIESNKLYAGGSSYNFPVTLATIPFFQKAGSIIPRRERIRRSAALTLDDPITLDIVVASDNTASGKLYLDDGYTNEYTSGKFLMTELKYSHGHLTNK